MEDNIIPLLYSKIKKNIVKKPYKLLGVTKNLTISTEEYSSFYKSSINIFQKKTFKVPEHTQYPLLRESQKKYISLRTRLNTFSFKDKKNKPKILMPSSAKTRIVNLFSEKEMLFICVKKVLQKLESEKEERSEKIRSKEDIYSADVTFVKGVGPKVCYILNKLGIFSVFDLISYFPRKYVDLCLRL